MSAPRQRPVSILDTDRLDRRPSAVGDDAVPHAGILAALERLAPSIAGTELPDRDDVEDLFDRVRERVAWIMSRCASVDVFVAAQLDVAAITDDVEAVYADLQVFCRWLSPVADPEVEPGAGDDYFPRLRYVAHRLIDAEQLLAHQVNQWLLFLQSRQGSDPSLRLFLTQVAAWHAHVKAALELRRDAIEARIDESASSVRQSASDPDGELVQRADALVEAGDLELLGAFVGLARLDRDRLVDFLREGRAYPHRERLLEGLWAVADLVLAEDPARRRGVADEESASSLVAILKSDPLVGGRFGVLRALLADGDPDVSPEMLRSRLQQADHVCSANDLETVWRALLVAHPTERIRRRSAAAAPLDALWRVLAYPHSPVRSLLVIAEVVAESRDDDLHKVFYDCVKSRLVTSIAESDGPDELELLARFVLLFFRFDFFIQTRYFEQLETMLQLFRAQARRFDVTVGTWSVDELDRDFQKLEVARHRAGSPEASAPSAATLSRLPLALQRHLAREGCYLTHFACHANPLIAREVVHYLHGENLGRFLELPELNRQMLEEALRRIDLTGRRERILQALVHPKCPMIFAGRHLPQLGRTDLNRIIQSRSTHAEVKRRAMLQVMKQQPSGA
ncbi:MAG: hypothetical protein AAGE94_11320 [Acidobacteriota bacterium]